MFSKLSAAFAIFAIAAQVVLASPPACLINAVNTQDNPHDIKSVCSGGAAKEVAKAISDNCGDAQDTATKWFADVCKGAGVTVATSSSSESSSKSSSTNSSSSESSTPSSGSATAESTGTKTKGVYPVGTGASSGFQTAIANSTSAAPSSTSPTTTGSDAPANTGAASRMGMDIVGLAAVGFFGAMIAL